jgi:hypothetical protein
VRQLKHLCQDDPGALDAVDRATVREHGGDRKSGQIKSNNVTLEETPKSQRGTSNTYALRKLRSCNPTHRATTPATLAKWRRVANIVFHPPYERYVRYDRLPF